MKVMGVFGNLTTAARRWYHHREIESSLSHYRERTGLDAEKRQMYSESGSFRSQLDRLFSLGNATETGELREIASNVVTVCLSNKYYRPADFLSDLVNALESRTFLSGEADGEPPLQELEEHHRKLKLEAIAHAWLAPIKVASIENLVATHAGALRGLLPYAALGRFERQAAKIYALIEQSEALFVEENLSEFLHRWKDDNGLRGRFKEPAEGLADVYQCLVGEIVPKGTDTLRLRRADQPCRLSTVVPENRQHLLRVVLKRLA
jgi:hypothetical protein